MKPFLQDPENGAWDGPDAALSMVRGGGQYDRIMEMQHYSLRTRGFRYILYNNGFEELYDHGKDPYEWTNVAKRPEYQPVQKRFRKQLDEMTGLKVGVIPPREPTPLEKGKTIEIDFEDFDLREDASVWPAGHRAGMMRNPKRVISGKTSLQLSAGGSLWNTVNFKTIEVPPGLTINVQFDLRAVDIKEGGYPYFILSQGKVKSKLTRIPIKVGETKRVTGTVTNDQEMVLPLLIGFHRGGTYLVDNLKVSKKQ